MKEYHILSLGAGVQSTALYLMAMEGMFHLDCAIFADTQDEPRAVYDHLKWLQSLNGPMIYVRSRGRLSDSLLQPKYVESKLMKARTRTASVPFFTRMPDGSIGKTKRQCSKEYKVEVVEKCIRRDILGLAPRKWIPKDVEVHQYFGISLDEARRATRLRERVKFCHFPLLDRGMTRNDCVGFLRPRVPHVVPKSACVYCPFHGNAQWSETQRVPEDWALALRVDNGIRDNGVIVNQGMNSEMFAHKTCVPLQDIDFAALMVAEQAKQAETLRVKKLQGVFEFNHFAEECEGMCGN